MVVSGRAGLLGLAISLVSTVPERVWYVKAKGYKPWLHPKPQDVKHNDEGGHTIWYNEPELLQVFPSPTASVVLHSTSCWDTFALCWRPLSRREPLSLQREGAGAGG